MAGQLQDPQDPHYTKDLHYPAHVLELVGRVLVRLDQEQRYEVRQYRQQIDHVKTALEELPLIRRGTEPKHVLEGEPCDAHSLHHSELRIVLKVPLLIIHLHTRNGVES